MGTANSIDGWLDGLFRRGNTARNPSRITESLSNPLLEKLLSWLVINSSKSDANRRN